MADTSEARATGGPAPGAPRTPPHDVQAEMGVLGSMLLSEDAIYLARERLSDASFYKLAHQHIFHSILQLSDRHNAVDLILLRDELNGQGRLEKAGGTAYLMELMEAVPTSANAEYYVEIVREHAVRRQLIGAAAAIQQNAYEQGHDVDDLLDRAESDVLAVRDAKHHGTTRDIDEVLQGIIGRLEELHQHPGQLTGLPSGYYDLDEITGGFQPGDLIVVAARPSMGKTTLALNMAHNVAVIQRKPVAVFSLEMPAEQLVSNFLCIHNRLDTHDFRVGSLKQQEWARLEASLDELVELPLIIDDSPSLSIMDMRARARRLAHEHDLSLIIIDYLQLMRTPRSHENRATEVADISRGLKALSRELKVPLIGIAQLNRRVEQEQRRPRMSDLRESGAIEQDADLILLLHRPQEPDDEDADQAAGNEADLLVAKHRNGPTGVVHLTFLKRYLRFESSAHRKQFQ